MADDSPQPRQIERLTQMFRSQCPRLVALIKHLAAIYHRTPVDAAREKTLRRYVRVSSLVVIGVLMLAVPAAAQLEEVGQALCSNGIGQILSLVFAAATLYFLLKAVFRGMAGLDKKGSKKPGTQQEGEEQLMGAAYSLAAAFAPPIVAAIFEIIGISTISCFDFNVGVFGMLVPVGGPLDPVVAIVGPMGAQGLSVAALAVVGYVRA